MMDAIFSKVGRAIAPAVAAMYSGLSALNPKRLQNSFVNEWATSFQLFSGSENSFE
jgi:hypothetical protein